MQKTGVQPFEDRFDFTHELSSTIRKEVISGSSKCIKNQLQNKSFIKEIENASILQKTYFVKSKSLLESAVCHHSRHSLTNQRICQRVLVAKLGRKPIPDSSIAEYSMDWPGNPSGPSTWSSLWIFINQLLTIC